MDIVIVTSQDLPVKSELIAWAQFMELTGAHPQVVGELIDMGWIAPRRTRTDQYLFQVSDVYRVRKLARLSRDLEIPPAASSIVVDLVERVSLLERRVRELERLIP